MDQREFRDIAAAAERGDRDAIWALVERMSPYLYRVVRRRLQLELRQRFDSADFVQMAWASFLLRDRRLTEFESEDAMRAFLAGVAANKVMQTARAHCKAAVRDRRREQAIDAAADGQLPACKTPSPADVCEFRDLWDNHVASQPPHYRRIVELRVEGRTCQEIADELALSERTVRRVLAKIAEEVAA